MNLKDTGDTQVCGDWLDTYIETNTQQSRNSHKWSYDDYATITGLLTDFQRIQKSRRERHFQ